MFIMFPIAVLTPFLVAYAIAALLPAVVLLHYVHRHDTVEKEPPWLLLRLLLWGMAAAVCSGIVERTAQRVLDRLVPSYSPVYNILLAFLVVAVTEEGFKFAFLYHSTWNHPAFDHKFDGIVYAVFVSLGFAALENLRYVFFYGLSVAIPRALLAVPGHMAFAIFMGLWYGRAKLYDGWREYRACRRRLWAGYAAAVFLHGVYDACALTGTVLSTVIFTVFVALMFYTAYRSLKRESENDVRVT